MCVPWRFKTDWRLDSVLCDRNASGIGCGKNHLMCFKKIYTTRCEWCVHWHYSCDRSLVWIFPQIDGVMSSFNVECIIFKSKNSHVRFNECFSMDINKQIINSKKPQSSQNVILCVSDNWGRWRGGMFEMWQWHYWIQAAPTYRWLQLCFKLNIYLSSLDCEM